MCDPTTVAAITVGSGLFSAYNQYQAGVAQNNYYKAQADANIAQGQAVLKSAQKQSELIQDAGSREMKQQKTEAAQLSSAQRAALVANGIDLSSVSAQDIASDTISKSKLDEIALRYNSDVKSWQTTEDAKYKNWALQTEADQLRYAGKMAKRAGIGNALGTLASTAASTAFMFKIGPSNLGPGTTSYGIKVPSRIQYGIQFR